MMMMTAKNHIFVTEIVIILARQRADHIDWLEMWTLLYLFFFLIKK